MGGPKVQVGGRVFYILEGSLTCPWFHGANQCVEFFSVELLITLGLPALGRPYTLNTGP